MKSRNTLFLIGSLFITLLIYNNFDSVPAQWNNLENFEISFDDQLNEMKKVDNFLDRRVMAGELIAQIKSNIRYLAKQKKLSEEQTLVSRSQIEITTHLRFLDIDIYRIQRSNCLAHLKRLEKLNDNSKKQKSSYRLIRALCNP